MRCGTIESGATSEETVDRCIAFCQSVGGGAATFLDSPGTTALCDAYNVCQRLPCPLP